MKYIAVEQEDFEELPTDIFNDRSIEDYKIGWDANGLHFIFWRKIMDFFKENGIAYKVMER